MFDVRMPQLGESVTEGTLGKWLKRVGETVDKYEPLVEVITDKVNAEIPSDFEGVLSEILVQEGETVHVGTVVCRISDGSVQSPISDASNHTSVVNMDANTQPQASSPLSATAARFSPAVLKIAAEQNVDLSQLTGTGEGGRITRKDVLKFVENRQISGFSPTEMDGMPSKDVLSKSEASSNGGTSAAAVLSPCTSSVEEEIIEPTAIRKTIARRMVESKQSAPHAWTMVEADVTDLTKLRTGLKNEFRQREGIELTYLPFFIKAVVDALKQYPIVNSSWKDELIHIKNRIHISIAVATDDALVVPVIHDADRLSISGIAHAVHDLATRARMGRLTMGDVQGGTFTVNNTGAFGSILSQPIINAPQAAILSVESIVKKPVVIHDAIAIRSMVNLCLSLDHRVLDGWVAGQFLKAIKDRLQSFSTDTSVF